MAIEITGRLNIPSATALSSDVIGGKLTGLQPGMTVYFTDTKTTQIARSDGVLIDYVIPATLSLGGDIEIGKVVIKDDTASTTAAVGANGLAVDAFINKIDQSVAESNSLSPLYGTQSVAVPGTAEPLAGSSTKVIMAVIFSKSTNTDDVYVGTAAVDKTSSKQMILRPGANVSIDAPLGFNFNLANFYVDAEVAGEGVDYMALR